MFLLALAVLSQALTRDQVVADTMHPYFGPSVHGVDASTLRGKVMCGYQGWFATPGDRLGRGWYHWSADGIFKPGHAKIDLWPDVTELSPSERYSTEFITASGKHAEVYSAQNRETVLRHFKWMRDYGLDGVFVQRFAGETIAPTSLKQFTTVLDHCREGANRYGRVYAVMYDLSGLGEGQTSVVIDDWKLLVDKMRITGDPAYVHHNGKPVVALWGFGFNDGRKYTLREGLRLVDFFEHDPRYGGCTVMLGVPTYWRTLDNGRDTLPDPELLHLISKADIISPWTVGRYDTPDRARQYAESTLAGDAKWCKEHRVEYMPVVFPGFSWHNMFPKYPLNQIPRRGGEFLRSQYEADMNQGVSMIYQAMFDEVDEGTAIFKVTNDPPVGESTFVTYEGKPSDWYLRIVGGESARLKGRH